MEENLADCNDEMWMRYAMALAKRAAENGEVPVGAVIIQNNQILGEGCNQPISLHDCTAHAEIVALRAAGDTVKNYRLPGATLYVTIEPCVMCAGAMIHGRIGRLVYGASEPKAGAIESNLSILSQDFINHQITVSSGVLEEECGEILSEFFKIRRSELKNKSRLEKNS